MKSDALHLVRKLPPRVLAGIITLSGSPADAGQVFWELNSFGLNLQSNGQPLTGATRFQLGVFKDGFVPTSTNVADWPEHWRSCGELQYDANAGSFSEEVRFDENPAPFTEGARLYCWAFLATSSTGSEYFLATDSGWLVPGTDPLAFPVFVDLETAGNVILGAAFPGSGTIRTAPAATAEAPAFLYTDWRRSKFSGGQRNDDMVSGPQADPDSDGRSNLLEYLSGTSPTIMDPPLALDMILSSGDVAGITLSFHSPPSARAHWEFQTSPAVVNWTTEIAFPAWDPVAEHWRISIPVTDSRRFWRLRALAPADP